MTEPAASPSAVDLERLQDVSDGDPDQMAKLVHLYLKTTEDQHQQLRAAVAAGRIDESGKIAHSWAGSSVMVGMNAIVAPLRALEQAADRGDAVQVQRSFEEAGRAYVRIKDFLKAHHLC